MSALETKVHSLFGNNVQIVSRRGIGGGCINDSTALRLSNGDTVFLKKNTLANPQMFEAEAVGLSRLICDGGPRVPKPIAAFTDSAHQYLLLEFLESGIRRGDYWEQFGRQLAHLHKTVRHPLFGFEIDNFIGATPQQNETRRSWIQFFREMRLEPQVRMAAGYLQGPLKNKLNRIMDRLDEFIVEPEGDASILHGDLWSGNAMAGPNGEPAIIDPATYFGHREAEIAMTQLFGRFGGRFYDAYNEYWPMQDGWQQRLDLYNLYHMLNHVNLFGSGYVSSVESITNTYL